MKGSTSSMLQTASPVFSLGHNQPDNGYEPKHKQVFYNYLIFKECEGCEGKKSKDLIFFAAKRDEKKGTKRLFYRKDSTDISIPADAALKT